jgi:hypothetical protein
MTDHTRADQERDWQVLHDAITRVLDRFGKKDARGKKDYWLVDDNWGPRRHRLLFQNLDLLRIDILHELQSVLAGYPEWCITIQVNVPGTEEIWPGMGVIVYADEIVDELRRDVLPERFRDIVFGTVSTETPEGVAERVRKLIKPPSGWKMTES